MIIQLNRRILSGFAAIITCLLLAGCSSAFPKMSDDIMLSEIRSATLPPTPKSVIGALLSSARIPLDVDSSCHNVGTSLEDATIGEYLSGFLSFMDDKRATNLVKVEITPSDNGWTAEVILNKYLAEENEIWNWGVRFFIREDGMIDPASYRCIGGG
ncbi:MAG: hypothetical protein LBI68_06310 [Azoarcus sp.]|jgi:hypothetical protein|nr:hypothetical protein [Azoarcus sp.]